MAVFTGLGSAASPSITFSADTNTGIFSPGADQVAISTNGVQRATIDSSGKLLINRSTSDTDGGNLYNRIETTALVGTDVYESGTSRTYPYGPNIVIQAESTSGVGLDSCGGFLVFRSRNTSGFDSTCWMGGIATPEGSGDFGRGGTLVFGRRSGSSYAESFRVTNNGRIGIGTTAPGGTVDIKAAAATVPLIVQGSSSEFARIDSSGRLLIGTSSTSAASTLVLQGYNGFNTDFSILRACVGVATPADGGVLGRIAFGDSAHSDGAWVEGYRDGGTWSGASKPSRLVFSTTADGASSPTERMRIRQDGLLLVNATSLDISSAHSIKSITDATSSTTTFASQTAALHLSASLGTQAEFAGASNVLVLSGNSGLATTTGNLLRGYSGNGGTTLNVQIAANGNVTNTNNSYGAISDFNLKENIADASSQWGDLKSLRVRKYNFKEETGYSTHTQIGLVAQEVELVSPGLVDESIDEEAGKITKSVNYSVLYMKAVKALQEAMERIETLEAKVAALEGV
jgi:hypothetical protein